MYDKWDNEKIILHIPKHFFFYIMDTLMEATH